MRCQRHITMLKKHGLLQLAPIKEGVKITKELERSPYGIQKFKISHTSSPTIKVPNEDPITLLYPNCPKIKELS